MPGPDVVYCVSGFVFAALAGWVAYALAFAPPLVPASVPARHVQPPREGESTTHPGG